MTQMIGVVVIVAALAVLAYWVWKMWFQNTSIGQTTTGKVVNATLDTAKLAANLGYVEILSKIDIIKASPNATRACETIADALWLGAIAAWKAAQTAVAETEVAAATTTDTTVKTAKVTATDGTVVEVNVQ
jgi:Tfp pilus assembly protein PilE